VKSVHQSLQLFTNLFVFSWKHSRFRAKQKFDINIYVRFRAVVFSNVQKTFSFELCSWGGGRIPPHPRSLAPGRLRHPPLSAHAHLVTWLWYWTIVASGWLIDSQLGCVILSVLDTDLSSGLVIALWFVRISSIPSWWYLPFCLYLLLIPWGMALVVSLEHLGGRTLIGWFISWEDL
jgi:hypothetical protein